MKRSLLYIAFAFVALLNSSCHDDVVVPECGNRTIICYMAIENSLYSAAKLDVEEMLSYASQMNDGDRIVLYIDDTELPKIYLIDNKTTSRKFDDMVPVYMYPSEENSCSEDAMTSFFVYVARYFPASSYGLILCSHGNAWYPSRLDKDNSSLCEGRIRKAFGVDNGTNSIRNQGNEMNIIEMSNAIHKLPHLDFIFFDLCYMQCIEIAYELRDCTDYVIGSPAEIPGNGAPYNIIMEDMFAEDFNPSGIINKYSVAYDGWYGRQSGIVISAIDCHRLDSLYDVTRSMIYKYGDKIEDINGSNVTNYLDYYESKWKYQTGLYDIQDMMYSMLSQEDYNVWEQSLNLTIPSKYVAPYIYSQVYDSSGKSMYVITNPEKCCGVSMSLDPSGYTDNKYVLSAYKNLQWKYK